MSAKEIDPKSPSHYRLPESLGFSVETSSLRAFSVIANRASIMLQSMYAPHYGLSVMGWRIIGILGRSLPLPAKTLCEMTAVDQVTISRAIEQLSAAKLVLRRVDPADRRRQLLRLSKRGREVYSDIIPLFYAIENLLLSRLSPEERNEFLRMMGIVMQQAGELDGERNDWLAIVQRYGHPPQVNQGDDGQA